MLLRVVARPGRTVEIAAVHGRQYANGASPVSMDATRHTLPTPTPATLLSRPNLHIADQVDSGSLYKHYRARLAAWQSIPFFKPARARTIQR